MRNKRIKKRILTVILMVAVFLAYQPMAAFAENAAISYLDEHGVTQTTTDYEDLDREISVLEGTYYVNADLEIGFHTRPDPLTHQDVEAFMRIMLFGDTTFIIADGKTLTIPAGIGTNGNTLKVYSQTAGSGQLIVKDDYNAANSGVAISGGKLIVNGGTVKCTSTYYFNSDNPAAINGGDLIVNRGSVVLTGGDANRDRQGAPGMSGGKLTVNGGSITVNGGDGGGTSTGGFGLSNTELTASGGQITITGGRGGSGNAGGAGVSGGTVTADGGNITITGGSGNGAGDGGVGILNAETIISSGESININGGNGDGDDSNGGAGIKGGTFSPEGGIVTIVGGTGGGTNGNGGDGIKGLDFTLDSDATVNITGGTSSRAGTGGVAFPDGKITVNKGTLNITGGPGSNGNNGAGGVESGSDAEDGGNGGDAVIGQLEINGGTATITGGAGGNGGIGGHATKQGTYRDGGVSGAGGNGGNGGVAFTGTLLEVKGGILNIIGGKGGNGGQGGESPSQGTSGNGGKSGKSGTGFSGTNLIVYKGATANIKGGAGGNGGSAGGGVFVSNDYGTPQAGEDGSAAFTGKKIEVNGGTIILNGGDGGDAGKGGYNCSDADGGECGAGFSGEEVVVNTDGTAKIYGGNGDNNINGAVAFSGNKFTANSAATIIVAGGAGGNGKNGGDAFSDAEVVINKCNTVNIQGGESGANGTGGCAVNGGSINITDSIATIMGGAGGDNGNGGAAFKGTTFDIEKSTLNYNGGAGGQGLEGVFGWQVTPGNGENGGNGGNGGIGGSLNVVSSTVNIIAGGAGNGGNGGQGLMEPGGIGGNGGNGGTGLNGTAVTLTDSTLSITAGAKGAGGEGGENIQSSILSDSGIAGTDGNAVTDSTTLPEMDGTIKINVSSHGSDEFSAWNGTTSLDTYRAITITSHNTHQFTYSSSGAQIKASCSVAGCNVQRTLTLTNPSNLTYDGTEKEVTVSDDELSAWEADNCIAPSDAVYYLSDGTTKTNAANSGAASEGAAPVKVGSYIAKMSVTDGESNTYTAGTSFAITKADNLTATVVMKDYTYGKTPSTPSLSGAGLTEDSTVTYYYNTTNSNSGGTKWENITGTTLNAGTYYIYAIITGTDDYGETITEATSFDIEQATLRGITVTMEGYKYGEEPSTPGIQGTLPPDATVTYYYSTTNSTSEGIEWKDITGTTLEIGTYYMYAVIGATDNYEEAVTPTKRFKVSNDTPGGEYDCCTTLLTFIGILLKTFVIDPFNKVKTKVETAVQKTIDRCPVLKIAISTCKLLKR